VLVLQRSKGEEIIIGEGSEAVRVCLVDVRGDKVRIGVEAARGVSVHRAEIYERIHGRLPEQKNGRAAGRLG
jgi:carbon storage regulator